jgi:hypothetical protein
MEWLPYFGHHNCKIYLSLKYYIPINANIFISRFKKEKGKVYTILTYLYHGCSLWYVLERNGNLPESPFGAWWQSMRKASVAPVLWSCWIRLPLFIWYFLLLFMALWVCHECRLVLSIVPSFSVTSGDATLEALVDMSPLSRCVHLGSVFLWAWRLWCNASLALELVKLGGIGGEDAFNL